MEIRITGRMECNLSLHDMQNIREILSASGEVTEQRVKQEMLDTSVTAAGNFRNQAVPQRVVIREDGSGLVVMKFGG